MADSAMTVSFEGKTYELEDFTLGELEWIEDQAGLSLDELSNFKAAVFFVAVIKRRTDPAVTIDDVRGIKLSQLDEPAAAEAESNGAGKKKTRPTKRATGPSQTSAGA